MVQNYLNLNYPITLYPDDERGGYVVEILDLPGCLSEGETLEEAVANINEARELWLEVAYESGRSIPLPSLDRRLGET
jgi:antitoxin HicB